MRLWVWTLGVLLLVFTAHGVAPAVFSEMKFIEAKTEARDTGRWLIVDFTAVWCGPCKQMDKSTWVDEEVVEWIKGHAIAIQIDYDKDPELIEHFNVKGLPTIIAMRSEAVVDRVGGFRSAEEFLTWMNELKRKHASAEPEAAASGDLIAMHDEARRLVRHEKPEEAAVAYALLWKAAAEKQWHGVNSSVIKREIRGLVILHPTSRDVFVPLRDATQRKLETIESDVEQRENRRARAEWVILNEILDDDARSLAWYDEQRVAGVKFWKIPAVGFLIEPLQRRGRAADIGMLLEEPSREVPAALNEQDGEWPADIGDSLAVRQRDRLTKLYSLYLAADRMAEARTMAELCLKHENSPRMRLALVERALDVEKPLAKHREWVSAAGRAGADVTAVRSRLETMLRREATINTR